MNYQDIIKNINILLADDDEDYLLMTYSFLKQLGYNVDKVTDGNQALEALQKKDYQIALLDYYMPGLTGEEVIHKIRENNKQLIIILQTGFSGQKPPIETMQNLNIQNYYDKTEGIDRLNLELISAVKIFKQQSEIELSKYKQNAIGSLINGIAQEIKADLLSVTASIELNNMLIKKIYDDTTKEDIDKLNGFYNNSKNTLLSIDKVLTSLINQSSKSSDSIMDATDVFELINLIVKNQVKIKALDYNSNISLRPNSYLKGNVNDIMYLICEIIKRITEVSKSNDKLKFSLTEDENNWLFDVESQNIKKLSGSFKYLIKMLITSIDDSRVHINENNIVIELLKVN